MPARTRSEKTQIVSGTIRNNLTGAIATRVGSNRFDRIDDVIKEGPGRPLTVRHVEQSGGTVNWANPNGFGSSWNGAQLLQLKDADGGFYANMWKGIPGEPVSFGALATTLLARTNPSRPVVDLPTYIAELREIPQLLRIEGNTLIRRAGSANLSYHFGWAPLLSDMFQLFAFQDQVSNRYKELKAFYDSGLRCKRQLWEGAGPSTHSGTYNSGDSLNITATHQLSQQAKIWGYVKWFPTTLPPQTDDALRSLARRAALGLTVDLSTAWNLLPWSWLVDWCSNVSEFLIAKRNIVPARHSDVLIMRHRVVEGACNFNDPRISNHRFKVEYKHRAIATPTLSAHLPVLSLRQLSILASIGVTRRVPRNQ